MSKDRVELRQNGQKYIGNIPEIAVRTLGLFREKHRGNAADVLSAIDEARASSFLGRTVAGASSITWLQDTSSIISERERRAARTFFSLDSSDNSG